MNFLFKTLQLGKLQTVWEKANDSLWLLPSILVVLAVLVSSLLLWLDAVYYDAIRQALPWLFSGTADAARGLLSTIATSVITVVSIAFSLTMVALQQVASQYSPRVLRTFTSDRGNQFVLGMYVATFTYALLVLRSVRTADEGGAAFVPTLSITAGLLFTLICLGLFIYYIHKVAQSLQVITIINRIHNDLVKQIDTLFPQKTGKAVDVKTVTVQTLKQNKKSYFVKAVMTGFVRKIDEQSLAHLHAKNLQWIAIKPQIGSFVTKGDIIAELNRADEENQTLFKAIQNTVVLDKQRSAEQDPLFSIQQLSDIALKAISPGINDPTTAEHCLFYLGDALARLGAREFPPNIQTFENNAIKLILNRPLWEEYVEHSFGQIRREADDEVHVTTTLLKVFHMLAIHIAPSNRTTPIKNQLIEIRRTMNKRPIHNSDKKALLQQITEIEKIIA